jgi:hypothetical protein
MSKTSMKRSITDKNEDKMKLELKKSCFWEG